MIKINVKRVLYINNPVRIQINKIIPFNVYAKALILREAAAVSVVIV